ncbi:undecaprenyl-phosphate alpha-N-acetylglucosaminyl 1-phosphate transferase [Idiomarina piscisalsi]|uniref:Undecaprenyl-phosphate alpha-N-acetylglucosaminyl 1-phosphate transferase n=1 Tax=Idiomarina piscisalsi TaxID=1096243 RepID=A0A432YR30_9GAMM|nr:undecaprenyl-phosphate alpha-N-acetylglucosaminyl 1-phosphate transferase [Idiomarina piscisalsi]RUO64100.1 undecaprenyl-phosphate alpha-N-acetylglucosaminyl 1-phosphate transferase [Idiomarina piscisalsi]
MTELSWLAIFLSFFVSASALIAFRKVAPSWGLLDKPSERKLHTIHSPLIGGLTVACGIAASAALWLPLSTLTVSFLVGAGLIILIGLLDDIYDVSVGVRLIGQIGVACIVTVYGDAYLVSLGNLMALGDIQLGLLAVPFTVVAFVGVMNAFNMIDGIDGLLGVSSLVALTSFTILSYLAGNSLLVWLGGVCIASVLPYFMSNLQADSHSFKVFMGDAGSLLMGFVLTWLFIVGSQPHLSNKVIEPVTALFLIAIPLMDIVTVLARRLKQKRSPWLADRQHIHHLFEKAGYSQRQTLVILTLIMFGVAFIGGALQYAEVVVWLRVSVLLLLIIGFIALTKLLKIRMTRLQNMQANVN